MADYEDVVKNIMSQVSGTNVQAIFGESRQIGDKVIIPVGRISYGWGSGGGKGKGMPKEGEGEGEGEGFGIGMGVNIKPMGYITVTTDRVTYDPIIDYGPIIAMGCMVLTLASLKFFKLMTMMAAKRHYKEKCIGKR